VINQPYRYVYTCTPIDWDWDLLPSLDQILNAEHGYYRDSEDDSDDSSDVAKHKQRLREDYRRAELLLSRHSYWEGDVSVARAVMLPYPEEFGFAVGAWVIKQENNGTTFIISRIPMPWLGPDMEVKEI